jgi:hypothetical protein
MGVFGFFKKDLKGFFDLNLPNQNSRLFWFFAIFFQKNSVLKSHWY